MKDIPAQKETTGRARKLPVTGTAELTWQGRRLPMIRERNGVWRVRSRAKDFPVDIGLRTSDLPAARRLARDLLDRG